MIFSIPIHADQVLKTENTENGGAGRGGVDAGISTFEAKRREA